MKVRRPKGSRNQTWWQRGWISYYSKSQVIALLHQIDHPILERDIDYDLRTASAELAKRVTSGDVAGIVGTVPEALRTSVGQIGKVAFADGFAAATLLAAAIAAAMALLTLLLVRRAETLPVTGGSNHLPASESRDSHTGEPLTSHDRVGLAE